MLREKKIVSARKVRRGYPGGAMGGLRNGKEKISEKNQKKWGG